MREKRLLRIGKGSGRVDSVGFGWAGPGLADAGCKTLAARWDQGWLPGGNLPVSGSSLFSVEWVRGDKKAIAEMAMSWVAMAGVSNRNGR
jgi:hypothetical protein